MKSVVLVLAVTAAFAAGVSYAQSGADVIKAKCAACHDADKKKVGPAFKEIAAKYKGDKAAVGTVIGKIKEGKGHPKVDAPDADLKAAVQQALATK